MKEEELLKCLQQAHKANSMLVREVERLVDKGVFSLGELKTLQQKSQDIMDQINFWIERGNIDRMFDELALYIEWTIKMLEDVKES